MNGHVPLRPVTVLTQTPKRGESMSSVGRLRTHFDRADEADVVTAAPVDFAGPGERVDTRVAPPSGRLCVRCGSPVESLDKFCPACGLPQAMEVESGASSPASGAPAASSGPDSRVVEATLADEQRRRFRCQQCSSEIATDTDQRSFRCPFCDSTYVVEFSPQESPRQRPEFVIGFAITPDEAHERFRKWVSSDSWFRPGDLRLTLIAEKMAGVYLPFWSFSMLARSRWAATIGEYWYRTETYTTTDSKGNTVTHTRQVREVEWWPLEGQHHRYYSGYLVSGSRGLAQGDADRIMPFQLPALRRYEPYFLSGWLAEEYTIDRDAAKVKCQQVFLDWERSNIAAFLPGDTHQSSFAVRTEFEHVNSDLCLLPVYVLRYRYQNKMYLFLLNGQTGRAWGSKPISWRKVLVAVIVAVLIVFLIVGVVALLSRNP